MWATNFYKSFFKKILWFMNGRLSNIRSVWSKVDSCFCEFLYSDAYLFLDDWSRGIFNYNLAQSEIGLLPPYHTFWPCAMCYSIFPINIFSGSLFYWCLLWSICARYDSLLPYNSSTSINQRRWNFAIKSVSFQWNSIKIGSTRLQAITCQTDSE